MTTDPRGTREQQVAAEMAAELEQGLPKKRSHHRRIPDRDLLAPKPPIEYPQPNPSSLDEQLAEGSRKMGVRLFHSEQIENAPVLPPPDRIGRR